MSAMGIVVDGREAAISGHSRCRPSQFVRRVSLILLFEIAKPQSITYAREHRTMALLSSTWLRSKTR